MRITFDEAKRSRTLEDRGLDFADAELVFMGGPPAITIPAPGDFGEDRFITAGLLRDRAVLVVWTPRDDGRRIISMRHMHEREQQRYLERVVLP